MSITSQDPKRADDLLFIVSRQRESGLDSAAYMYADLQAALRRVGALEAEVAKLNEALAATRNAPGPKAKRKPLA